MADASFRLKGGMVPMTVLELHRFDPADFTDQLIETVEQAPAFFKQTPVIVSFEKLDQSQGETVDLQYIDAMCRKHGLIPVALRASESFSASAQAQGMGFIPAATPRPVEVPAESQAESAATKAEVAEANQESAATADVAEPVASAERVDCAEPEQAEPDQMAEPRSAVASDECSAQMTQSTEVTKPVHAVTRVVHHPVRSGQQVYAQGGDLIVLASVSEGAEVLADGNIHVYGALRGRALAGVLGDESARIFCQSMEAELISIAGHFKLSDDLKNEAWRRPAQTYFDTNALHVVPLS